ncbi:MULTISPECIES: hypothetical protein [Rhodococcus]|uniref:hypothetical protein n=1 Tax=Rhodococcus TaxID=1827 RepID=UPI00143E615F|nr:MULTISPECIES: hypothetical protein [Rhodococcus]QIX48941.1 hypothetical protein HFP48_04800 [Rhodococcus sp. DMU1]QRI76008.1 hypothetical protein JQ505_26630 [Rhodococcus aetherivorans]QSE59419.1 hypothetical protein JYA75_27730 [Rhodococcus sp. PSBB066]QSE69256.1 hypothetical protein JYA91_27725 [Rhodococcus sp. PSBB049]
MSTDNLDTITSIDTQDVRRYGGEQREPKKPFKFQIGESPTFYVQEPDADTVMDIEEARTSRSVLKLFLGDQYDDVADFLGPQDPDVLIDLARDLSKHFGLFDAEQAVNRADRRSRDRRRSGRRR